MSKTHFGRVAIKKTWQVQVLARRYHQYYKDKITTHANILSPKYLDAETHSFLLVSDFFLPLGLPVLSTSTLTY